MTPPGRVVRVIRRAFYANPGRELTTRELWSWTHPREVHCRDRFRPKNISRAIRAAAERMCVRVGRRPPRSGGVLWKLRDPSLSDGRKHGQELPLRKLLFEFSGERRDRRPHGERWFFTPPGARPNAAN
jgi:hypothetical protein